MNIIQRGLLSIARAFFPDLFLSRNDREIRRIRSAIRRRELCSEPDPFAYLRNQRAARVLCALLQRRGNAKDILERDVLIDRYGLSIS